MIDFEKEAEGIASSETFPEAKDKAMVALFAAYTEGRAQAGMEMETTFTDHMALMLKALRRLRSTWAPPRSPDPKS